MDRGNERITAGHQEFTCGSWSCILSKASQDACVLSPATFRCTRAVLEQVESWIQQIRGHEKGTRERRGYARE